MTIHVPVVVTCATEGIVDEAVVRRLIRDAGAEPGPAHGKNGKPGLHKHVIGYNHAARYGPWIVIADLDMDATCAPTMRSAWLTTPSHYMCFRIAVRQIESWLLADRESIASYLGVAASRVPLDVEALQNAKDTMVNLARRSRRRDVREDMVPRSTSGRPIGPAYASRLIDFAENVWMPQIAASRSDSLHRAIRCLRSIVDRYEQSLSS